MLNVLRTWIMDAFGFSKSEANGTLILLFIVFLGIIIPKLLLHNSQTSPESFTANKESLQKWANELESSVELKPAYRNKNVEETRVLKRFRFDPNTAGLGDLLSLGFEERASRNLIKYRNNGGRFVIKSDLKKIYGISPEKVDDLWAYIQLPEEMEASPALKDEIEPETKETPFTIDANTATAEEYQKIRGIGPVLSKRIVSFREKLGGFHSKDQLHQVYGLDSSVVDDLKQHLIFSSYVRKININTDSLQPLYSHPYINYNTARAIVNYREQHGDYESINQLKSIKIINDSLYQKIYPYLSLHP